ncbi:MAG: protease modulator HflC, partial [Planctomycetes bacterium]|nr:protease modulator HflC [Planctomycetota bacterium]
DAAADAWRIYAVAYAQAPVFNAVAPSPVPWTGWLGARDTTLILSTSSELLQHLRKSEN